MTGRDCCVGRRRRGKTGRKASAVMFLLVLSLLFGGCGQDWGSWSESARETAEQRGFDQEIAEQRDFDRETAEQRDFDREEAGKPEDEVRAEERKTEIVLVHNNPCEACDEEGRFLEALAESVSKSELRDGCEVRTYYAYREPGYGLAEKAAEYFGLEKSDIRYPLVIVGDTCLLGYDQIRAELEGALERAAETGNRRAVIQAGEDTPGEQEISSGSGDNPGAEGRESTGFGDRQEILGGGEGNPGAGSQESPDFANGQTTSTGGKQVPDLGTDTVHLLYFYTENCSKCEKAEAFLEQLPDHVVVGEKDYNIVITSLSVAEEDNALYFGALASQRNVPEREQQVPFLFLGEKYLSGEAEIRRQVPELLEAGEGLGVVYGTEEIVEQQEKPLLFLLRTAGVGFLNGFNPCALSLVLLFFSLMAALPEGFLRHGITFLVGKFTAYMLLGMAAARAFSMIPFGSFRLLRRGINLILILFCAGLALGNFLDCFHAFRGEYGKIKLQLPGWLRSRNDRLVKKLAESSGKKAFGILIFGGSMAVALGEFFCTGQIYLAAILQWIQRAESGRVPVLALAVYSAALCLPALALLLLVHRGRSAVSLAGQSLKGMPWIKLCNGILFVVFAVMAAAYL